MGLLSRSAAYQLTLPYLSFQCYPVSFSGVNRKISFASRQLPPLPVSQLSPFLNHTQGRAANVTAGKMADPYLSRPLPAKLPVGPAPGAHGHLLTGSGAEPCCDDCGCEGFTSCNRHRQGLKWQEIHLVFWLRSPSPPLHHSWRVFFNSGNSVNPEKSLVQ